MTMKRCAPAYEMSSVMSFGPSKGKGWCLIFEEFVSLPYPDRDEALRCVKLHKGCGALLYMVKVTWKDKTA